MTPTILALTLAMPYSFIEVIDLPMEAAPDVPLRVEKNVVITRVFHGLANVKVMLRHVPDYGTYVEHRKAMHPGEPVMSYEEFFRERQDSRYGGKDGKMGRCC